MSLLPQNVHVALSQLLLALASADNIVRTQAEEQLNNEWVKGRPDVLLIGLAEQLQGAEDAGVCTRKDIPCLSIIPYLFLFARFVEYMCVYVYIYLVIVS